MINMDDIYECCANCCYSKKINDFDYLCVFEDKEVIVNWKQFCSAYEFSEDKFNETE